MRAASAAQSAAVTLSAAATITSLLTSNVFLPNFTLAMETQYVNAGAGPPPVLRVSEIPEKNARLLLPLLHLPIAMTLLCDSA